MSMQTLRTLVFLKSIIALNNCIIVHIKALYTVSAKKNRTWLQPPSYYIFLKLHLAWLNLLSIWWDLLLWLYTLSFRTNKHCRYHFNDFQYKISIWMVNYHLIFISSQDFQQKHRKQNSYLNKTQLISPLSLHSYEKSTFEQQQQQINAIICNIFKL